MKRIITIITLLLTIGLVSSISAQSKYITINGTQRSYLEYVPSGLGTKPALLISAHGMNQDAAYQKNMLSVESLADKEKFITVFPQGINNSWDITGTTDVNFISALIDKMVKDYDIDPNRVYMSGFSMGGMLTYHCMNYLSEKIAAFAPISGYLIYGFTCNAKRPIPVIHTHGTADDVVVFSGLQAHLDKVIAFDKCNTTPTVTTNYQGYSHVTRRVWGGGTNGTQVVLMELANKGHWVSNDGYKTVQGIWDFCKNYSLEPKPVQITITSPEANAIVSPNFHVKGSVTCSKAGIKIAKLYMDNSLKQTVNSEQFFDRQSVASAERTVNNEATAEFDFYCENVADGEHTIIALAYDSLNNQSGTKVMVTVSSTATAVSAIKETDETTIINTPVYNLQGQRVGTPIKGQIYVRKGKTFIY